MKKALYISFAIVVLLGAGIFIYFQYWGTDGIPTNSNTNTPANTNAVACTMEAKLCPDGSAVGRTGPNCEFAACPEVEQE
ncbi:MAG: hypothetical protein WC505_01930 [Patescibacteria group bacterium]